MEVNKPLVLQLPGCPLAPFTVGVPKSHIIIEELDKGPGAAILNARAPTVAKSLQYL